MNKASNNSLFSELRDRLGALGSDLREMAALRWQLARLELASDLRSIVKLAIVWLAAVVMVLTALPLAAVCLADVLDGVLYISRAGWLAIFAVGLVLTAILGGWLAWRQFCRAFVGLRETLEEFREDMAWLQNKP